MKKLTIVAAIVCAAVMSQAAALDWALKSSSAIYAGYNAASIGGKYSAGNATADSAAYLIYFNSDDGVGLKQNDLLTALRSGKTVDEAAGQYLFSGEGAVGAVGSGFSGSKASYELRKICIDHIYQRFGAEKAVSISGDDIRTISRYYADPAQPNIGSVRVMDLIG